ncbi:MAG: beta-lactamase family protein [Phycisphaerae bacterium]|nr:beta-lactamase family protein [Phycisphaerae bacterium]
MKHKVLPVLGLAIFLAAYSYAAPRAQTVDERIDRLFAKWDSKTSPGCTVVVIHHGKCVIKKSYGMADIEAGKTIDEQTLFNVATLSRHFTGAAAASLIDNGAVRLTDNIRVTIPEMRRVDPPVTVQDLIYHTSGLPDYISVWKKAGAGDAEDTLAMVDLLADAELLFSPGSRFAVSRSDYLLLGLVAQRVTSASLAQWAQNAVFKPAGMVHSVFCDHPEGLPAGAVGYKAKPFGGYSKAANPLPRIAGDVGLWTNILDLAIWEKSLLENTPNTAGFYDLLQRTGKTDGGRQIDYAFGLNVEKYRDRTVFTHNGRANGFSAGLLRFPEENLTVICLSNLESFKTAPFLKKIADFYLGR